MMGVGSTRPLGTLFCFFKGKPYLTKRALHDPQVSSGCVLSLFLHEYATSTVAAVFCFCV